jgi:predicted RNA-binding Zn ribbon-like protein
MRVNPYGEDPVRLAVDLVNTPPTTPPELRRRCNEAGMVVDWQVSEQELADTLRFLRDWQGLADVQGEQARAEVLNESLATYATHPSLTDHDGKGWHLHYRPDGLSLDRVLRSMVNVATALHLATRGMHRLGRCAAPGCDRVYADFTRPGTQRYCSPRCANRDAVRRHRERQREAS